MLIRRISSTGGRDGEKQLKFWDVEERLKEISVDGDPLEILAGAVGIERFRPILEWVAENPPGFGCRAEVQNARAAESSPTVALTATAAMVRPARRDTFLRFRAA